MSSAGRCIARSTSSGIVVGPGIARNSRPERTTILLFLVDLSGEGMPGNGGKFKPVSDFTVVASSFETPAGGGLLRMRFQTLMVRSAATPRVSNHEATKSHY